MHEGRRNLQHPEDCGQVPAFLRFYIHETAILYMTSVDSCPQAYWISRHLVTDITDGEKMELATVILQYDRLTH